MKLVSLARERDPFSRNNGLGVRFYAPLIGSYLWAGSLVSFAGSLALFHFVIFLSIWPVSFLIALLRSCRDGPVLAYLPSVRDLSENSRRSNETCPDKLKRKALEFLGFVVVDWSLSLAGFVS
jgi:hypothetical protein